MTRDYDDYKLSENQKLICFVGALFFIVPTFLSIPGVTFIGIIAFTIFILLNKKIHSKISLIEIYLPFIIIFSYLNLYLIGTINHHGIYKTIMINSTLLLSIIITTSISNVHVFLKYSSLIISLCSFIVLLGISYTGFNLNVNERLSVGNINPIWLGRFSGMAILILYNQKSLIFSKYLYLINFFIIFLSGSKGPIIGLILVGIFHFMKSIKLILSMVILVIFLFFAFSYLSDELKLYITSRFLRLNPNSTEFFQEIEEDRLSIIITSITNYFKSADLSSFFFGLGPNQSSFYYYNSLINERWYPHNIFLEIFFEYGFIAILFFVYTLFKTRFWQSSLINSLILYFLVNALFSGDLPLNWLLFLFISIKLIR